MTFGETMRTKYMIALLLVSTGCATHQLAPGVSYQAKPTGDIVITLQPDAAVLIKEGSTNGALSCIGYVNGMISFVQIADGGATPVGVDIKNRQPYRITRTIHNGTNVTEYFDTDADGIPDMKLEFSGDQSGPTVFKRKSIEWEQKNSE